MEPTKREPGSGTYADSEAARFWGEPAEDRQGEFEDK